MEYQMLVKRTQIAKFVFSAEDNDAAEARAAELLRHTKSQQTAVFAGCKSEWDYALESTDPNGPVIFGFDD